MTEFPGEKHYDIDKQPNLLNVCEQYSSCPWERQYYLYTSLWNLADIWKMEEWIIRNIIKYQQIYPDSKITLNYEHVHQSWMIYHLCVFDIEMD